MTGTAVTWEGPGCPFHIEFAADKLEEIRVAVTGGFYAVPHGGIEIGGVLFGSRTGLRLRIEEYRMVDCEHSKGPGYQLSENDRAGFAKAIAEGPGQALGWFHSHTRSGIFLTAEDLEVHDAFFPEAWQVALVLRPENMRPVRAGYFFRGAGGVIAAEKTVREFAVEPAAREQHAGELAETPAAAGPAPEPVEFAARSATRKRIWTLVAAIVSLLASVLLLYSYK